MGHLSIQLCMQQKLKIVVDCLRAYHIKNENCFKKKYMKYLMMKLVQL